MKIRNTFKTVSLSALLISPLAMVAFAAGTGSYESYSPSKTYDSAGNYVTYTENVDGKIKTATFVNSWWTQGETPRFYPNDGPWKMVGKAEITDETSGAAVIESVPEWNANAAYAGGSQVSKNGVRTSQTSDWGPGLSPTWAVVLMTFLSLHGI